MSREKLKTLVSDHKIMTKAMQHKLYNLGGHYISGYSKKLPTGSKCIKEFEYDGKQYIGIGLYQKSINCGNGYRAMLSQCIAFEI